MVTPVIFVINNNLHLGNLDEVDILQQYFTTSLSDSRKKILVKSLKQNLRFWLTLKIVILLASFKECKGTFECYLYFSVFGNLRERQRSQDY